MTAHGHIVESPTVAAITLDPTGGGIAVVSEMLWRVFQEQWGPRAQLRTVFSHESRPATLTEKARFALSLASAEAVGRTDWILFSHMGLAKVQNMLPGSLRRPYGVFLHGIEVWKALDRGERRALAGADLLLANSRYTASRVTEMYPEVGPIAVCPLALPPPPGAVDNSVDAAALRPLGRHVVLVVGRMLAAEKYKGHDQLIEAWPRVVATVPDAQLVIVGDGDDARRLKKKAADASPGGRVLFTGFVSQATLDALYHRAALFALPSRGEGFGLVYLEAMARSLPCVGSIHDAAREVIVDGHTGRLVDQSDVRDLADTLTALLLDSEQRRRMGEAGRSRLLAEFSFDCFSKRVRRLLDVGVPAAAGAA